MMPAFVFGGISLAWAFLLYFMVDSVFILKIQEGRSGLSLTVQGVISIFSYLEMFPVSPLDL